MGPSLGLAPSLGLTGIWTLGKNLLESPEFNFSTFKIERILVPIFKKLL